MAGRFWRENRVLRRKDFSEKIAALIFFLGGELSRLNGV
jgi:hypothetical protein